MGLVPTVNVPVSVTGVPANVTGVTAVIAFAIVCGWLTGWMIVALMFGTLIVTGPVPNGPAVKVAGGPLELDPTRIVGAARAGGLVFSVMLVPPLNVLCPARVTGLGLRTDRLPAPVIASLTTVL